jgi:hypothetical protein
MTGFAIARPYHGNRAAVTGDEVRRFVQRRRAILDGKTGIGDGELVRIAMVRRA